MLFMYLYLFLAWGVFYALHSMLASLYFKNITERFLPFVYTHYRISYNIFAVLSLLLVLTFQYSLPKELLFEPHWLVHIFAGLCIFLGGAVIFLAFKNYPLREFLGIRKEQIAPSQLAVRGLNQWVRHPLYSGVLLCLLGFVCWEPSLRSLVLGAALLIYLVIGIHLEEQKLLLFFGESYRAYQKKVKKLIPKIY